MYSQFHVHPVDGDCTPVNRTQRASNPPISMLLAFRSKNRATSCSQACWGGALLQTQDPRHRQSFLLRKRTISPMPCWHPHLTNQTTCWMWYFRG